MFRRTTLVLTLAGALAACSSNKSDVEAPPEQTRNATEVSELTPEEGNARFSHTVYPEKPVAETGTFGKSPDSALVAASTGEKVQLASLQAKGPVVLIFYRGHW